VYALGIVLFELLCGRSPYRGGAPAEVLGRHGSCSPVPPPGLPPVVWPVIEACLTLDPRQRPAADAVAGRLRGVEPALDGMEALPALAPEAVTWWPRPAAATMATVAVAPAVAWVPMASAPVSPASAYAGRMTAIPVAGVEGYDDYQVPVISGPPVDVMMHNGPTSSALPVPTTPDPVEPAGAKRNAPGEPAPAMAARSGQRGRRRRRMITAGVSAAGAALAATLAGVAFLNEPVVEREPAGRPGAIPATSAPAPDSSRAPGPSGAALPGPSGVRVPGPSGAAAPGAAGPGSVVEAAPGRPDQAAVTASATASPAPDRGTGVSLDPGITQLPGIGDPMPSLPGVTSD
jgi:serine/threonine-protein kinase